MTVILLIIISILLLIIASALNPETTGALFEILGALLLGLIGLAILCGLGLYVYWWFNNFEAAHWWQHVIGTVICLGVFGVIEDTVGE